MSIVHAGRGIHAGETLLYKIMRPYRGWGSKWFPLPLKKPAKKPWMLVGVNKFTTWLCMIVWGYTSMNWLLQLYLHVNVITHSTVLCSCMVDCCAHQVHKECKFSSTCIHTLKWSSCNHWSTSTVSAKVYSCFGEYGSGSKTWDGYEFQLRTLHTWPNLGRIPIPDFTWMVHVPLDCNNPYFFWL